MRRYALAALLFAATAYARHHHEFSPPPPFMVNGTPAGGVTAATGGPAHLTASRIAAVDGGALAIDADSGKLLLVDEDGKPRGELAIAADAGLLAYDPIAKRAFVADRRGDRVVVVEHMKQVAAWRTPAEPYAIAIVPDRSLVLVSAIADRALVAYAPDGTERWRVALGAEPRGLAISPDGTRALVSYLAEGAVDEIDLPTHTARRVAIAPTESTHARGAYVATYLGDKLAVTAYEAEKPFEPNPERLGGGYGAGEDPPISEELAFFGTRGQLARAFTDLHEVRGLAWDAAHDTLYAGGMGGDAVVKIAHASQVDPTGSALAIAGPRCGIDGIAVGDRIYAWCAFDRSVAVVGKGRGPSLAPSTMDDTRHAGMVAFHTADPRVSAFGQIACANCHLDGRADGLSWRIEGHDLQTPVLCGRMAGTAPYKWDGGARDLPTSIVQTVQRLGGSGLDKQTVKQLAAYLEAMPAAHVPSRSPAAIWRGKQLFAATGCNTCHDGDTLTDNEKHLNQDTPSLIGLAASAPYFHDGSAATLEAVLRERSSVHGMSDAALKLTDDEVRDLIAYLEST